MKTRISLYCLAAISMLMLSSCRPDVEACFSSTANAGTVAFNSDCSIEATGFDWDFGDGSTSIAPNPTHIYAASGNYDVTLRTTDKKGRSSTISKKVTVTVDLCFGVSCLNGTCVNGTCQCNPGYEGPTCSTAMNQKFAGIFAAVETCNPTGTAGPYTITVSTGFTARDVNFVGLWEVPTNVIAAQIGTNGLTFSIARQFLFSGFDIESISGTINAAGTQIDLNYRIYENTNGQVVDQCTMVMTK